MALRFVLPHGSPLHKAFSCAVKNQRIVLFAGLSAVGKSLYLQQLTQMALEQGRQVHLLQWDVTRAAFETPEYLTKYPEVNGVTHAMIRKAVGHWSRQGVLSWHQQFSDPKHILIGEVPLIENRLIELVQVCNDDVEVLLASDATRFFLPVPSKQVRAHIESARAHTIAAPRHAREGADAPPNVVRENWQSLFTLAVNLGLTDVPTATCADNIAYDDKVYASGFEYLLQHRRFETLLINDILPVAESVYEMDAVTSELAALPGEVKAIVAQLEQQYKQDEIQSMIDNWHKL